MQGCTSFDESSYAYSGYNLVPMKLTSSLCPKHSRLATSELCLCDSGYTKDVTGTSCAAVDEYDSSKKDLPYCVHPGVGHPIYPLTGANRETVDLVLGLSWPQAFSLTYDTARRLPLAGSPQPGDEGTDLVDTELPAFGELWLSNLHRRFKVSATARVIRVARGDGHIVSFLLDDAGNSVAADRDVNDRLVLSGPNILYIDAKNHVQEVYTPQGMLTNMVNAAGRSLSFTYSDGNTPSAIAPGPGYLIQVTDSFGRAVKFQYSLSGFIVRVGQITDVANQLIVPGYNSGGGTLTSLTWPDGRVRQFMYERSDLPWAMTGIVDESNARMLSFEYDSAGRAIATQFAGGVGRYSVSYATPPSVLVTDTPDLVTRSIRRKRSMSTPSSVVVTLPETLTGGALATATLDAGDLLDMARLTNRSQPGGAGCNGSTTRQTYDSTNGNITQRDDFNGHRVCYAYDGSNRETARVEGLSNTAACSTYVADNAALPAGTRKTSTQWHPAWRMPTKVAEAGRITTYVYNGRPDPFNAGATASCAPSTATLPDGQPITVLCKQVEQSTTDTDGHLGFTAALQTGVAARVQTWTYNQYGQVLTAIDPRSNKTTYAYYSDTTADYTMGDLKSVTNALMQVTQYTKYNPHGQVLQMVDLNNITTDYQYDQRQRLTRVTTAGHITRYDYWPTGLLKQVTQPDASYITYTYDDAHRLTDIADNLGNSVHYTLDNSGNRTKEEIKDNAGTLRAQMNRTYDALNRVQQTRIGRE